MSCKSNFIDFFHRLSRLYCNNFVEIQGNNLGTFILDAMQPARRGSHERGVGQDHAQKSSQSLRWRFQADKRFKTQGKGKLLKVIFVRKIIFCCLM